MNKVITYKHVETGAAGNTAPAPDTGMIIIRIQKAKYF